jgi:hypothetical protein
LCIELTLDGLKEFSIQDGWLLAGKDLTFKRDFTDIEAVTKKVGERTSGKRYSAYRDASR